MSGGLPLKLAGAATGLAAIALALWPVPQPGPALLAGVAALLATGTLAAPLLGLIGIAAAASSVAAPHPTPLTWAGVLLAAAAAGLAARHLQRALPLLLGPRAVGTGVLLLLGLMATLGLPDGHLALLLPGGDPAMLTALLTDPTTGSRLATTLPAVVPQAPPLDGLACLALFAAPLAAWGLLAALASGSVRHTRRAWALAALVGALALVVGLAGLAQLTGGAAPAIDLLTLSTELSRQSGGVPAVEVIALPEGLRLGLSSRPLVDPLRILAGALLIALAVSRLRATPADVAAPAPADPDISELPEPLQPAPSPLLPAAVALGVLAAAALAPTPVAWTLAAAAVAAGVALFGGLTTARSARLPHDLLIVALTLWVVGLAGPWAGWIPG